MAEVRTLTNLQDAMDQELGWRIKEISTFKIEAAKGGREPKPLPELA